MIKAVIFDLDGTLLDPKEFIFQAYEHTFATHGLKVVGREQLRPHIGRGLKIIYREFVPDFDYDSLITTHANFQARSLHLIKIFPKVLETVKKLKDKGLKLAIVTSRMKNTETSLKVAGLDPKLFDAIITADDIQNLKPNPEGTLLALKKLKVKASEAILVGDAIVDIEMGKNAGVKTVAITWGFGGEDISISKPDYLIKKIEELEKIISLV